MKKRMLRCMALVLCLLLTATMAQADGYDDHILLGWKDGGTCHVLAGDTALIVVFVDVPGAEWDSSAMEARKASIAQAADTLVTEAASHDVSLTFSTEYHASEAEKAIRLNDGVSWADAALDAAGLSLFACDEGETSPYQDTPVLFCLNTGGRAFAQVGVSETDAEYLVLYEDDAATTIRHELLHLYGAQDYYGMDVFASAAEEYLPGSIMQSLSDENTTDSLTAYIIGWTSTLDVSAARFLKATEHVTYEDASAASMANQITGYTVDVDDGYVYTGMMVDGLYHGMGRMVLSNGDTYEGEWEWGQRTGKGVFTWANGDSYTGDFVNGACTGKGIFRYASGDMYVGEMVDLQRMGDGIFIWASGATYIGGFSNNMFCGKGTLTSTEGWAYTGDFVNDQRTGKGTFTWADGASYTGDFVNGLMHGYGSYTYADGTVQTGQWNNNAFVGE